MVCHLHLPEARSHSPATGLGRLISGINLCTRASHLNLKLRGASPQLSLLVPQCAQFHLWPKFLKTKKSPRKITLRVPHHDAKRARKSSLPIPARDTIGTSAMLLKERSRDPTTIWKKLSNASSKTTKTKRIIVLLAKILVAVLMCLLVSEMLSVLE